jgi:hypothetical protein
MCRPENLILRGAGPLIAAFAILAGANMSFAQPANPAPGQGATCPPDAKGDPPTVGGGSSEPLSVDPEMQVRPPGGGQMKVIPPPGTPGGDPNVQPK